jgi:hypothetical protein
VAANQSTPCTVTSSWQRCSVTPTLSANSGTGWNAREQWRLRLGSQNLETGNLDRGEYGLRTMKSEKPTTLPALPSSSYCKGCPSPTVDLLLVLDPKHNDTTIRRNGKTAYGQAAGNRNGVPVDATRITSFLATGSGLLFSGIAYSNM